MGWVAAAVAVVVVVGQSVGTSAIVINVENGAEKEEVVMTCMCYDVRLPLC